MKRPGMDLQETLARLKAESGLTTDALSAQSGVPKGTLNKLLNGETKNPRGNTLRRLADTLNCPVEALCGAEEEEPAPATEAARQLRERGEAREGLDTVILARRDEDVTRFGAIPTLPAHDFHLIMHGSAMVGAGIKDGDTVFVRRQRDAEDGKIVCVRLNGSVTLRRVYHLPDGLELLADNPQLPPYLARSGRTDECEILGLVVAFLSIPR